MIGAGLHGLVTAKVLLHASEKPFSSVTIYERGPELGGVWAASRIYDGLTTNSPLLTYEIPDFPYPPNLRVPGTHASAHDVLSYLHAYADKYAITEQIKFDTDVRDVSWNTGSSTWMVKSTSNGGDICQSFRYVVVCTGLYHTNHNPLKESMISRYTGSVVHSSKIGTKSVRDTLATSNSVAVVGAGKSALDLATILARGHWMTGDWTTSTVTLIYRRPHWLSPRKILRKTTHFEKVLFSRFVNAWLPYFEPPDRFHKWIAETRFGRWQTRQIFSIVADDFIKSNNQHDLPKTIPTHPLKQALSGALHVEPPGYIDCVRSGRIRLVEGSISGMNGKTVSVRVNGKEDIAFEADNVLLATGYKLALPFFSNQTCQLLGILKPEDASCDKNDLPYVRLYRLVVPPGYAKPGEQQFPHAENGLRNIAFNGYAYSLLNPTVAHVTAHWISDLFSGRIKLPTRQMIEKEVDDFHTWQTDSFGALGAKGVHIGSHATLYTDRLIGDMGLPSGHLSTSIWRPGNFFREWFRPMYPEIYSAVEVDRKARATTNVQTKLGTETQSLTMQQGREANVWKGVLFILFSIGLFKLCGFPK